ncbi:hypothetical protein DESPIG_00604 [Desulfovibrio piger ATCC 29098]|uniref:Uncharacterized protein n=1 Tax=Desulfovibrio piger ATCC 29098 TaxID=411464 RepID=B6WRB7_9BACT|nr:hypothetical protein DESPIG_00604 [Desulfovibrio piger ATCC 29098]
MFFLSARRQPPSCPAAAPRIHFIRGNAAIWRHLRPCRAARFLSRTAGLSLAMQFCLF